VLVPLLHWYVHHGPPLLERLFVIVQGRAFVPALLQHSQQPCEQTVLLARAV
jgi:hypothetical protein